MTSYNDQESDFAYFAKQDADWEEQEAYESSHRECSSCGILAFEPWPCTTCVAEGKKDLRYCEDCSTKCPSCDEYICAAHRSDTSKLCAGCTAEGEAEVREMLDRVSRGGP